MYKDFLEKLEDEENLKDRELWIELAYINNPLVEKKITQKGYSFLSPILKKSDNLEEVITPLLLLCYDKEIPNKNEILSRWLAETLIQEKFTKSKNTINYRNHQQEKLFMFFIEQNNIDMIEKIIYWSKEMPYPHKVISYEDVKKYIFKNLSIEGLKNFSSSWSDNVWLTKWKFEKNLWDYEPHDFEANPESFWPIERQSFNLDWMKAVLEAGCPTNMLMQGFFDEKEIETIMLRILKLSFYFHNHEYHNKNNENIKKLWIRDEKYLMKMLSLFVSHGGKIEGNWNGIAWWEEWRNLRKNIKDWTSWNEQTLSYIDSFAQQYEINKKMSISMAHKKVEKNLKERI